MITTDAQLDSALDAAVLAAPAFAAIPATQRAASLAAIADALEANADELVAVGMRETALAEARLRGELTRTAVQLRMFADVITDGSYLGVRIDEADPDFVLGPKPDLRRISVPFGPVLNFAASNFPFAFSVVGGDTASALAAGSPVIVKAHEGHVELSQLTSAIASAALSAAGIPDGTLQIIYGREVGVAALKDRRIRAASFTGSVVGGRALADIAAARADPIPFYGELGSINPVVITSTALRERGESIAQGLVGSVSGSAGQLCTKPGVIVLARGHGLDATLADLAAGMPEHRLLHRGISDAYIEHRNRLLAIDGMRFIAEGSTRLDDGFAWVTPTILAIDAVAVTPANAETVLGECFGPLAVLLEVESDDDLVGAFEAVTPGTLTATLHIGSDERGVVEDLTRIAVAMAGRVLFDGWPTGVAVTAAQQHGGPWPSTTAPTTTSVGTAAIARFVRPVAYQNAPAWLLPEALRPAPAS
jgi:NADP-dependent aldehyde dehydrogenase